MLRAVSDVGKGDKRLGVGGNEAKASHGSLPDESDGVDKNGHRCGWC